MALFNPVPIDNPRFKTPGGFIIRRTTMTVDNDGVPVKTTIDIPAEGVVIPSGALGMVRTPEEERVGDGITIYSRTIMQTADPAGNHPADDVIWHGQLWQVTSQDDYSDFGFNVAQATLQDATGGNIAA
jgi:hypothetical protein